MTEAATAFAPEPVPLVRDEAGRLMVIGSRISLDILVSDFKRGESPEAIHDAYETVTLADVCSVLAYYLGHRGEVEAYLAEQDREANNTQARIEQAFPPAVAGPNSSHGSTSEGPGGLLGFGGPADRCASR